MFVYTLRRLILAIPVLFAVLFITFTLGFYGPGDPLEIFYNEELVSDPEITQRLRELHGLDRPFWEQFVDYFAGLLQGDWGDSISSGAPSLARLCGIHADIGTAWFGGCGRTRGSRNTDGSPGGSKAKHVG